PFDRIEQQQFEKLVVGQHLEPGLEHALAHPLAMAPVVRPSGVRSAAIVAGGYRLQRPRQLRPRVIAAEVPALSGLVPGAARLAQQQAVGPRIAADAPKRVAALDAQANRQSVHSASSLVLSASTRPVTSWRTR